VPCQHKCVLSACLCSCQHACAVISMLLNLSSCLCGWCTLTVCPCLDFLPSVASFPPLFSFFLFPSAFFLGAFMGVSWGFSWVFPFKEITLFGFVVGPCTGSSCVWLSMNGIRACMGFAPWHTPRARSTRVLSCVTEAQGRQS
jgi:hypothetical protein